MTVAENEQKALKLALEGHNVLISGQCGIGKTCLLNKEQSQISWLAP